jgi:hypothetical protein
VRGLGFHRTTVPRCFAQTGDGIPGQLAPAKTGGQEALAFMPAMVQE